MRSEPSDQTAVFSSVNDVTATLTLPTNSVTHTDILTAEPVVLSELAMPSLDDIHSSVPTQACGAITKTQQAVPVTSVEKPISGCTRKSREPKTQGTEKSQELSKKLVKALTEKILKRMNQKNDQTGDKTELDTAVSTLTSVNNSESNVGIQSTISEPIDVSSTTVVIGDNPEEILGNLPENLPVIEASNIDASPTTMTSYSDMTTPGHSHLQVSTSVLPPHTNSVNRCIQTAANVQQTHVLIDTSTCPQTTSGHVQTLDTMPTIPTQTVAKHPPYLKHNSVPNGHLSTYTAVTTNPNSCIDTVNGNAAVPQMYYFADPNNSTAPPGFMFPSQPPGTFPPKTPESEIMLERYIQQQNSFCGDQAGYHYGEPGREPYLKSPDSGYGEPCISPPNSINRSQVSYMLGHFVDHE